MNNERKKEYNREYTRKHPDVVARQRINYATRKIEEKLKIDPGYEIKLDRKIRNEFAKLTRLKFNNILPELCEICGSRRNLEIHHIHYIYPIVKDDIIRLCYECHKNEHQKIELSKSREDMISHGTF